MNHLNQHSKLIGIVAVVIVLIILLALTAFKPSGRNYNKTIFVNRASSANQIQALIQACADDSLRIMKVDAAGKVGQMIRKGFVGVRGLDWANIGDYAYVAVGGNVDRFKVLRYDAALDDWQQVVGKAPDPPR